MAARASSVNFQQPNPFSEGIPAEATCTDVRLQRVALNTFASLAILGGVALISLSAVNIIAWPIAFCSIPLFALAAGAIYWARKIIDYQNPIELRYYRDEAETLAFSRLVEKHGLENLQHITSQEQRWEKFRAEFGFDSLSVLLKKYPLHTICQYDLLPTEDLKQKFTREFLSMRQMDDFHFNLRDLLKHRILSQDLFNSLCDLYNARDNENRRWAEVKSRLDRQYPHRTERLLQQIRERKEAARGQAYRSAQATREIGFSATAAAMAMQNSSSNRSEARNALATGLAGIALTEVAAASVEAISRQAEQVHLDSLNTQEILVSTNGEYRRAQEKFDAELDRIYRMHLSIIGGLNVQFGELQNSYRQSAFEPGAPELDSK